MKRCAFLTAVLIYALLFTPVSGIAFRGHHGGHHGHHSRHYGGYHGYRHHDYGFRGYSYGRYYYGGRRDTGKTARYRNLFRTPRLPSYTITTSGGNKIIVGDGAGGER